MIILTEWDTSDIVIQHLNKNPHYADLSNDLKDKIIDCVCDYVADVDISSKDLFEILEYEHELLERFTSKQ